MIKQTQQQILLEALKVGPVNSYFATFNMRIKQAPTRIKELRQSGYLITSKTNADRSVDWILVGSPTPIAKVIPKTRIETYHDDQGYEHIREIPDIPVQQNLI